MIASNKSSVFNEELTNQLNKNGTKRTYDNNFKFRVANGPEIRTRRNIRSSRKNIGIWRKDLEKYKNTSF